MSALKVATIIVAYKNVEDIAECLYALDRQDIDGQNHIFIVENGGGVAYHRLIERLEQQPQLRRETLVTPPWHDIGAIPFVSVMVFASSNRHNRIYVAQANQNLGYGGGINSWLQRLQVEGSWDGYWILNPDTAPMAGALTALVSAVTEQSKGMASSIIVAFDDKKTVHTTGIYWSDLRCSVVLAGAGECLPLSAEAAKGIDSPSGCSLYVTRDCVARIGLMPDDYFLYYEDIEWGMRAKAADMLASCVTSIVPHKHGSTIGSAARRADRSVLSVYLGMRNRLLFVKRTRPLLLPWALLRSVLAVVEYLLVGSPRNGRAALAGLVAGIKGERHRPPFLD